MPTFPVICRGAESRAEQGLGLGLGLGLGGTGGTGTGTGTGTGRTGNLWREDWKSPPPAPQELVVEISSDSDVSDAENQ